MMKKFLAPVLVALLMMIQAPAYAAEEPGIHDFAAGMSRDQVASILVNQYGLKFKGGSDWTDRGGKLARYTPTAENPEGVLDREFHLGSENFPGLDGYMVDGNSDMSFIFVNDRLVQVHIPVTGIKAPELIDKLKSLYGGEIYRFDDSKYDHYVAPTPEYTVFATYEPAYTKTIVSYSFPGADDQISACVQAAQTQNGSGENLDAKL